MNNVVIHDAEEHPENYYDCETDTKDDDYKFGQIIGIEPQYDELCTSFTDEYNWDNLSNQGDLITDNGNFLGEIDDLIKEHSNNSKDMNNNLSENNVVVSSSTINMGQCDSKSIVTDSNPTAKTNIIVVPKKKIKYTFCCLCGKYDFEHKNERHHFFAAFEDHRCIKCNKWFFQHNHKKNPCWQPTKYLS